MARKFVDQDEAAKMLGVSPDTLNEMRERQKIYGYRDGGNWKFKPEDVERLIAEREAAEEEGEFAEIDEDPDSILLSEVELGGSNESTSSTIIGGRTDRDAGESDIRLASDSDIQLSQPKHDSNLDLGGPLTLGSDIKEGSGIHGGGSGVSPMFEELDTLDLEMESAADSGIFSTPPSASPAGSAAKSGGSSLSLGDDALTLGGSNLSLGDDELSLGEASGLGLNDSKAGGSAIDLAGDEDGDLVLGGSSHGDLSRTGDSGISLLDPADSGLSLESAPLDLGGSAVESLELGEDDMILVDDPGKSAAASVSGIGAASGISPEPGGDDDFLLTPLEEATAEESDSGSQVIVLVGDDEFGDADAAPAAAGDSQASLGGLLEEDLGAGLSDSTISSARPAAAGAALAAAAAAGPVAGGAVMMPEAPFSVWNVVSLAMCAVLLMVVGMFMFDLLRNMWSWNGAYAVNSQLMDAVMSWFK